MSSKSVDLGMADPFKFAALKVGIQKMILISGKM